LYAGNCIPFSKWTESVIKLGSRLAFSTARFIAFVSYVEECLTKSVSSLVESLSRVLDIIFITWWTISLISVLRTYFLKAVRKGIEDSAAASVTDLGDASRDITGTADVSRSSIAKGKGTEENRFCS
jgi:hypothetical protein